MIHDIPQFESDAHRLAWEADQRALAVEQIRARFAKDATAPPNGFIMADLDEALADLRSLVVELRDRTAKNELDILSLTEKVELGHRSLDAKLGELLAENADNAAS